MAERSQQLDQISEAIGELRGSVKAIEKYIHEDRHGVNNLSLKVDALGVSIGKDIAAVEARIEAKLGDVDSRVTILEADKHRREGAIGLVEWLGRHWPLTVIAAALAGIVAWANGIISR